MANYKEIVTKAVLGKGKKTFIDQYTVTPSCTPTTVLGCWIINHKFSGKKVGNKVVIDGQYDVNIWYSCQDDTSTEVIKETRTYQENVQIKHNENLDTGDTEIIIRSLMQPKCRNVSINGDAIEYTVEKELGVEIVGDTKVKIQYDEEEEPWDNLDDDEIKEEEILNEIDSQVNEDYLTKEETE